MRPRPLVLLLVGILALLAACAERTDPAATGGPANDDGSAADAIQHPALLAPPTMADDRPIDYPGLTNVVAYGESVLSGSAPDPDEGCAAHAALGVRTVLSVDGEQPDVEAARRHGLRYVHLPVRYSGIEEERALEIARAVDALEAPIYIHCHHGKHRSAAAASAATRLLGRLTERQAAERMRVSGTSPAYPGLLECAATEPADPAALAAVGTDFPERQAVAGLVETMIEIGHVAAHLEAIGARWSVPEDHPDLVPAAEAGRLVDLYRTIHDDPDARAKGAAFERAVDDAIEAAQALEDGLVAGAPATDLDAAWARVGGACQSCHVAHRNSPR